MKRSSPSATMPRMDTTRGADDLREVIRVLLLVQGAILVATTLEALVWSLAFAGAPRTTAMLSAAAAAIVLVARARVRADRRWMRRLVYVVEGAILVTFALDAVLALLITGGTPPLVAAVTGLALPVAIIALLVRSTRATTAAPHAVVATEGAS